MARKEIHPSCWNCHKVLPIMKFHSIQNYKCDYCKAQYADKPRVEAQLFQLQDQYLSNHSQVVLGHMLLIVKELAYNLVAKKLKSSARFLSDEEVEEKTAFVVEKMLLYYRRPHFKISISFVEYINRIILYPLYNYKDQDRDINEVSLFSPIKKSGTNLQSDKKEQLLIDKLSEESYLDGVNEIENLLFKEEQKLNILNQTGDFFKMILEQAYQYKGFSYALKFSILYNHFLNKQSPRFLNEWWAKEGFDMRDNFEKTLTMFRESLRSLGRN